MAEARFADLSVDHHVHWLEYVGTSNTTPNASTSEDDDEDVTGRGARYRALLDLRRVSAAVRTAVEVRVRDAVAEACFEVMGAYRRMLDAPGQGGVTGLPQFMSNAAWRLPESCKRQRLINCHPCWNVSYRRNQRRRQRLWTKSPFTAVTALRELLAGPAAHLLAPSCGGGSARAAMAPA
jgi:hypothetical protein